MDKRLLLEQMLAAYKEIVPDASTSGEFLIRKLSAAMYARGARISIGAPSVALVKTIHHSIDMDRRIVWTDREWNKVLGYRADNVLGRHIDDFLTPESAAVARETSWPELVRTGRFGPGVFTLVSYEGVALPCVGKSEMLRDEDGLFVRTFSKIRAQLPTVIGRIVALFPMSLTFALLKLEVI